MEEDWEVAHNPSIPRARTALVRVGFSPSPRLDDALHLFLKPKYENRHVPLYSEPHRVLSYSDSDNDGPIYDDIDASRLARDKIRLRGMGYQSIALNAIMANVSARGDVHIRIELKPSPQQRRMLGGFVLGRAIAEPDVPLWLYTHLWHKLAAPEQAINQEVTRINRLIEVPEGSRASHDIASLFYVTTPEILQRTGDLHIAP